MKDPLVASAITVSVLWTVLLIISAACAPIVSTPVGCEEALRNGRDLTLDAFDRSEWRDTAVKLCSR